jgi:hypothetical protein
MHEHFVPSAGIGNVRTNIPSRYDQFVSRFVPGGTNRVRAPRWTAIGRPRPNESWETKPLLNCFKLRAPGVAAAAAASETAFAAGRADRERARPALHFELLLARRELRPWLRLRGRAARAGGAARAERRAAGQGCGQGARAGSDRWPTQVT